MLKVFEVGYRYKNNTSLRVENVVVRSEDLAFDKILERDYREADAIGIGDTIVKSDYEFIYSKLLIRELVV